MGSIKVFDKIAEKWRRITPDEISAIKTDNVKLLEYLGGLPVATAEQVFEKLVDDTLRLKRNVNWLAKYKPGKTQDLSSYTQSDGSIKHIVAITQEAFDALLDKDPQTLREVI